MEEYTIRYATAEDYTDVERIMMQVQNLHVGWRPDVYRKTDVILPHVEFEGAVARHEFIVAESAGKIIGILFYVIRHVESGTQVTRNTLFIDSIAVDEAYRGRGIGHRLLDFAKKLREVRNLDAVELQVNARNLAARSLYESYGFAEKSINMELL